MITCNSYSDTDAINGSNTSNESSTSEKSVSVRSAEEDSENPLLDLDFLKIMNLNTIQDQNKITPAQNSYVHGDSDTDSKYVLTIRDENSTQDASVIKPIQDTYSYGDGSVDYMNIQTLNTIVDKDNNGALGTVDQPMYEFSATVSTGTK